jgi:hypothetical protein
MRKLHSNCSGANNAITLLLLSSLLLLLRILRVRVLALLSLALLLVGLVKRRLFLLCKHVVHGVVGTVLLVLLEVLELSLPDATEGRGRVLSDLRPGRLSAKELDVVGLGGHGDAAVGCAGHAGDAADVGRADAADTGADVGAAEDVVVAAEAAAAEDVLGDEGLGVEDHDGLGLAGAAVGDQDGLSKDVLLELVAAAVVNGDLDLLDDHDDGGLVVVAVPEVGLAEEVVHVVVEAILLLVDDEHLVDLLHDLLLEAVVDDLEVLLLDLDDLLLLVEVVEAVNEVEAIATEAVGDTRLALVVRERLG